MTDKEALRMALEALEWMVANDDTNEGDEPVERLGGQSWNEYNAYWLDGLNNSRAAINAIKQALASPVQDNSNYRLDPPGLDALYTTPPAQPAPTTDIADIIAGELKVSRGTAYDLMREALKEASLVEPVCEKDPQGCWNVRCQLGKKCIYTTPPAAKRQWVELTDEERTEIRREHYARTLPLIDAVEAKLKERNQ
jgi:hypothetical protein